MCLKRVAHFPCSETKRHSSYMYFFLILFCFDSFVWRYTKSAKTASISMEHYNNPENRRVSLERVLGIEGNSRLNGMTSRTLQEKYTRLCGCSPSRWLCKCPFAASQRHAGPKRHPGPRPARERSKGPNHAHPLAGAWQLRFAVEEIVRDDMAIKVDRGYHPKTQRRREGGATI